ERAPSLGGADVPRAGAAGSRLNQMLGFGPWNLAPDGRVVWPAPDCIRCGEAPQVAELGYCVQCNHAVRAEVEAGFKALCRYLRAWALFADWCAERGQGIA